MNSDPVVAVALHLLSFKKSDISDYQTMNIGQAIFLLSDNQLLDCCGLSAVFVQLRNIIMGQFYL